MMAGQMLGSNGRRTCRLIGSGKTGAASLYLVAQAGRIISPLSRAGAATAWDNISNWDTGQAARRTFQLSFTDRQRQLTRQSAASGGCARAMIIIHLRLSPSRKAMDSSSTRTASAIGITGRASNTNAGSIDHRQLVHRHALRRSSQCAGCWRLHFWNRLSASSKHHGSTRTNFERPN